MKKGPVTKGFAVGCVLGVLFVAYRIFKYGGGSRSELPDYVAVSLAFGVTGAILGWGVHLIRERLRRKQ